MLPKKRFPKPKYLGTPGKFGYLMAPRRSVAQNFPSSQTLPSSMCQITWSW